MRVYVNMATRWTAEEQKTLNNLLENGLEVNTLMEAFPNRTKDAILIRARANGFGSKKTNGVSTIKVGVNRRVCANERLEEITGDENSATTNSPSSTVSELTINESNASIADNTENINRDDFLAIYEDISALIKSNNYTSLKSISVELSHESFTLTKALS